MLSFVGLPMESWRQSHGAEESKSGLGIKTKNLSKNFRHGIGKIPLPAAFIVFLQWVHVHYRFAIFLIDQAMSSFS